MKSIGLIGFGAFGKLIVKHLSDSCDFVIYDPLVAPTTLKQALAQPVIIFALPAQHLDNFLITNKASLNTTALYIDVCSVKIKPVETMARLLPKSADIIATHPLFGPATANESLVGQKIMLYPARVENELYETTKKFLADHGLQIIEVSPAEHDQAMAYVQGLSHYIGRIMQTMQIPETILATQAYQDLLDMKNVQGNDSDDLFLSIVHENPFTKDIIKNFDAAQAAINAKFL